MSIPPAGAPGSLRLVPLGGLGEIGLNLCLLELVPEGGDAPAAAIAIDCGVMFPSLDTPGIDLIIPDLSYPLGLGERLLGVVLTHGHEDHIGALPFLLRERELAVHGSPFTIRLVAAKLEEHGLGNGSRLSIFRPGERFRLGPFDVETIRMTHSIPDSVGLAIRTPVGTVVHTGDFKIDHTPIDGEASDLGRLAEIGSEGVMLLLSDSTNAAEPGITPSERSVGRGLERVFRNARGKVLATTFASHIHRLQQFVDLSSRFDRKIAVIGRSLVQNVEIAAEIGKLEIPRELRIGVEAVSEQPSERVTVIAGGSQGEPRSALARIANDDHPHVKAEPGDAVVMSARVIPGNERAISTIVNHLCRRGAEVYWERSAEVHTSGHASQEELKLVLRLVRPRFFVPVHGEYRHLARHRQLAIESGVDPERCFVVEDGQTLLLAPGEARRGEDVAAGRVFVDGKGVGDVAEVVLRDRRHLAQDGVVLAIVGVHPPTGEVVAGPDLVSRGFLVEDASQDVLEQAKGAVVRSLAELSPDSRADAVEVQEAVRRTLKRFFDKRLDRRPMILPFIVEM